MNGIKSKKPSITNLATSTALPLLKIKQLMLVI